MNDFFAFARERGLILDEVLHGRWTRVPTVDHPRSRNGAFFFGGEYALVQNWATMDRPDVWRDGIRRSPADTAAMERRIAASQEKHRKERAELQSKAAAKARHIIGSSRIEQHAYPDSKKVNGGQGLVWRPREGENLLVIPMRIGADIVGCQLIDRDGVKKFLYGQRTSGAEFVIGSRGMDIWCEGWATAHSIHAALTGLNIQCRVHATFSAGNLQRMASTGIIVADNDASLAGEIVAKAAGRPYFLPPAVGWDFNDFVRSEGLLRAGMELARFIRSLAKKCP